ncbi:hypothetical protein MPL3356_340044 [Mesorhizobium plurifarium]|uniref:Uncharacterized protein n=1 Tax=Mesorhizobium plurifarium TaxID=69974 RepID=A0A090DV20_MESPL|nr:hypothetical protein MPL3356_340044 [Mesorhizobium plurifarium]
MVEGFAVEDASKTARRDIKLLGIARSEPGIGRARVPELGVAGKRNSRKRPEMGRI